MPNATKYQGTTEIYFGAAQPLEVQVYDADLSHGLTPATRKRPDFTLFNRTQSSLCEMLADRREPPGDAQNPRA